MNEEERFEGKLTASQIFRHPECRRVSTCILKLGKRAVVYGPSGSGVSMFARAHADVYWDPFRTSHVILDDAITTTDLFDQHPGLREGAHRFVLIDLAQPWTRNVIRNLFRRIPTHVCVVIVSPVLVPDCDCIVVNTQDPNENYMFLSANAVYFTYFRLAETEAYYLFHRKSRGNLARAMQRYKYGTDEVDVLDHLDPFAVRTREESDYFFSLNPEFDFSTSGSVEWRARALDVRSFCDTRMANIYGTEDQTDTLMRNYAATMWHVAMKELRL